MESRRIFQDEKYTLSRDSCTRLLENCRITENLLWREGKSSTVENRWTLYAQKKQDSSTVNQLMSLIGTLQDKMNVLSEEEEFYYPETASSSGMSHVPSQSSRIPSPRDMPSRDSGLPYYLRNSMHTSGNVFESPAAQERTSPSLPCHSKKNLADSFCEGTRNCNETWECWYLEFCVSYWSIQFSKLYDGTSEKYFLGLAFWEISRPGWLSVMESHLQDRSVRKHIYSSTHHVVDQWSGGDWICRRSYDVAVNETRVFSWFWGAWCEDCVCVEKDHFEHLL